MGRLPKPVDVTQVAWNFESVTPPVTSQKGNCVPAREQYQRDELIKGQSGSKISNFNTWYFQTRNP
jgi:hypothetical protein